MISIDVEKTFSKSVSMRSLEKFAAEIMRISGIDQQTDLSILIGSDETLQQLNAQYLGYDQPTDVLSFGSNEVDPETGRTILGDIAISYPAAEHQANEAKHSVQNEMVLLLTHAILHLSGFDHRTKEEKQQMWQKQQLILDKLDIKINRVSGDEEFHD